jgi:large subunit ribosomal protein L47
MRAIKHVLTERFYLWEDAAKLAKDDPEVDLSGEGNPYTPMEYLEEEEGSLEARSEEVEQGKEKLESKV